MPSLASSQDSSLMRYKNCDPTFQLQGNPLRPFEEASLLALNTTTEGLSKALKELDQVATRTQDTVLVFYVKAEQGDAHEIIENQASNA